MHLHDINTLLNLQGVIITDILESINKTVCLTLESEDRIQFCPSCGSTHFSDEPLLVIVLDLWLQLIVTSVYSVPRSLYFYSIKIFM